MAAPQASSRLEMLQARFQQKQLQEKEQKLLQLYDQQQQRAYQVAQRGSSGSNGSVQGTSTVSHHHQIVTRTSSSGNTTSTSQPTKVKQAFKERRQTSVKGIDRSYPLEPIDNKTRKQAISNGVGNARNNGPIVNRQSITVKRVTRSDVNSNVNDGKPVVSYHEEITRESSSGDVPQIESRKEVDGEEFGNENRATHYVNGNHHDQVQIREFMDEDTIQRNRMMAKLHLMQYDETMKNRVRNDLESEEFPEELLVEVSDKIPKRTVSKKLSQAETRLQRFKSMNAKRNNANKLSNSTTTTTSKKRSDQLFPSRTISRSSGTGVTTTTKTTKTKKRENFGEKRSTVGDVNVKNGQGEFEKSKTELAKTRNVGYDRKTGRTSTERAIFQKRKADVPVDAETIYPTDTPRFFSKELEKSSRTISIDTSVPRPRSISNTKEQERVVGRVASTKRVKNFPTSDRTNDNGRTFAKRTKERTESPSFYRKKSESSTTTTSVESKGSPSPELIRNIKKRDTSPEFFCVENEKSATTMSLKPRPGIFEEDKHDGIGSSKDFRLFQTTRKPTAKQSPSYIKVERKMRKSSRSPETSERESSCELRSRRGSNSPLRSTELIRSIMKTQDRREVGTSLSVDDRSKIYSPGGPTETTLKTSRGRNDREDFKTPLEKKARVDPIKRGPFKIDLKDMSNSDNVMDIRRKTSVSKSTDEPSSPRSSPRSPKSPKSTKSFASTEVDTEIQEITMTDQHVPYKNPTNEERNSGKSKKPISGKTFTKSSAIESGTAEKVVSENLFTYSVRREGKKRASVLESDIFRRRDEIDEVRASEEGNRSLNAKSSKRKQGRESIDRKVSTRENSSREKRSSIGEGTIVSASKRQNSGYLKTIKKDSLRSRTTSCSSNEDTTKRRSTNVSLKDITFDDSSSGSRERSVSPLYKRVVPTSGEEIKKPSVKEELLRSTELIRRVIRAQSIDKQEIDIGDADLGSSTRDGHPKVDTFSTRISTISLTTKTNYYGRTDSVESALRRFDSIGVESEYQDTMGRDSVDNVTREPRSKDTLDKKLTRTSSEGENLLGSKTKGINSKTHSKDVKGNLGILKKSPGVTKKAIPAGKGLSRKTGTREKRIAEARDSMEIKRVQAKSRSPTCKRRLFREDSNFEKRIESKGSRTKEPSIDRKGNDVPVRSMETSGRDEKHEEEVDRSVSVKPLRSIEDIRKSIVSASGETTIALTQITDIDPARAGETGSAIANQILKASTSTKLEKQSRVVAGVDPLNKKRWCPSIDRSMSNLSDVSRSSNYGKILPKNSTRVSRTAKSPSPDTMPTKKLTETATRRSVPPSPSKSPDILHKRVTSTKSSYSIAFKKTTTKSDVPNGGVHQNGLHTQEEVVEKKNQTEVPRKNQAFTVNLEERSSSKRTDTTDSKRPLTKKQSIEKQQSSSTTAGRPTSSTSSASSGSSTQAHGNNSKGRMATRVRTPTSAGSKGCTPLKGGLNQSTPVNLIACKVCGRRFTQDRVALHEQICAKSVQKKRKQFDTTLYRIRGTDLESCGVKATKRACEKPRKPEIKTNWRRKHEEFINAIRSAKQVQAHLAAGGKLSDLPPPPVSDTSDYIPCPHCGRKFNQAAAERHIPKCEHMMHNKPAARPTPPRPRR